MTEASLPALVQLIAATLFSIGVYGVLGRRNLIVVLMSIELMLNAANLSLVGFSRELAASPDAAQAGQVLVLMAMAVAAAEVAVGLSILIAVFRHARSVDLEAPRVTTLRH